MSDFTTRNRFPIQKPINQLLLIETTAKIEKVEGVENISVSNDSICIDYYPQLVEHNELIDLIEKEGLLIDTTKPEEIKGIRKFLKKLEISNKKSFGTGQLDCCDLNQKNK